MRLLIAIILFAHGIGQIMPFMAAWTPGISKGLFSDRPWIFSAGVTAASPVGRIFGLLALVALAGFIAGAWGMLARAEWWRPVLIAAAIVSLVVLVPWWNAWPLMNKVGNALVNIAVLTGLLTGLGDRLVR